MSTESIGQRIWNNLGTFVVRPADLATTRAGRTGMVALSAIAWVGTLFIFPTAGGIHHAVKYLQDKLNRTALKTKIAQESVSLSPPNKLAIQNFQEQSSGFSEELNTALQTGGLPYQLVRDTAQAYKRKIPPDIEATLKDIEAKTPHTITLKELAQVFKDTSALLRTFTTQALERNLSSRLQLIQQYRRLQALIQNYATQNSISIDNMPSKLKTMSLSIHDQVTHALNVKDIIYPQPEEKTQ